jgi:hypothetical protein
MQAVGDRQIATGRSREVVWMTLMRPVPVCIGRWWIEPEGKFFSELEGALQLNEVAVSPPPLLAQRYILILGNSRKDEKCLTTPKRDRENLRYR